MAKYEQISDKPEVQKFYEEMRSRGEDHNIARICALRRAPSGLNTDRAIFQGKMNGAEMGEMMPNLAKRRAKDYKKATGMALPQSAIYLSTAARFPGDPKAYFTDVADVRKHCRETGEGCEALGIKPTDVGPPPKPKKPDLHPRLVNRRLQAELAKPEHRGKARDPKTVTKLVEQIKGKHTYDAEA